MQLVDSSARAVTGPNLTLLGMLIVSRLGEG